MTMLFVQWEAAAAELDVVASWVAGIAEPAIRLSGEETWIGPAADDGKVALGAVTGRMRALSVALHAVAAAIRARAEAERARYLASLQAAAGE